MIYFVLIYEIISRFPKYDIESFHMQFIFSKIHVPGTCYSSFQHHFTGSEISKRRSYFKFKSFKKCLVFIMLVPSCCGLIQFTVLFFFRIKKEKEYNALDEVTTKKDKGRND